MICTNCNFSNRPGSTFCQNCGQSLSTQQPTVNQSQQPVSAQAYAPPQPTNLRSQQAPTPPPANVAGQDAQATAGFWGPFAGYGNRTNYNTWLLDNLGNREASFHQAITQRFQQRQVPGSTMQHITLTASGVLVAQRPYYFVKREITTVALYISQFGNDLFISQSTYIKSPISNARVIAFVMMILYLMFFPGFIGARISAYADGFGFLGGGSSVGFPIFSLLCGGPIYSMSVISILVFFIYTIYKTIKDKDPLAGLRRAPDEFNKDDAEALEKAVEETVRQSLDSIGVQANMMPKAQKQSFSSGGMRLI